ncbi:DNA helicase [Anaerosporomusa subterranea]|uniref:DNA helicase n=1 Tax=Anaerosporomusa subterranea TaxID=1794912 RepID=A0A154BW12_ANASB|nr:UvrD-helicase domain-containing protein [Anaerosporomusa subterranea]KYZ78107.1 DNA helicase [Anaerosporomusa subterranea]
MENNHPEFPLEKQHLENTIQEMKQIIIDLDADIDVRLHKIGKARTNKDEVSAYVHSLMKSDHAAKIYDIEHALASPYFGRVDFREDGTEQFEQFYIGRTKISRLDIQKASDILVFDWRDPVSAIFYECQDGRATYEVLGRYSYTGEVRLKRQYKIEDGQLIAMSDDDILGKLINRQQESLIADPFLKERLLQGASDRLKDIVTSIRSEQNLIIREPLNQVTVIQGVAGSGKSTIGLHRLSYLLYNDKLNPSRLAVVAPNRIFLDYISELLPDLDVQDAKQLTFEDIAIAILQMTPRFSQQQLASEQTAALARWKGSPQFVEVLQEFLDRQIQKFCLKLTDLTLFDNQLIITKEQQLEKVVEGAQVPYNERLTTLEKHIRFRIRNFLEVLRVRLNRGEHGISDELLQRFHQEAESFLNKHFAKWPNLKLLTGYAAVYADKPAWKSLKRLGADYEELAAHTLPLLQQGKIEREDLAPLCYLKYLIDGTDHMEKYDHIVIDEGQDLSLLEYMVLRRLSRNMSFTIMGDMFQGIHAGRGLESWQALLKEVFGEARSHYYEVNYSYRSAKEIVDLFNKVMPDGRSKAIPVYEIGRQPQIVRAASTVDGIRRLAAAITEFKELGCQSIGIISRQESDSEEIYTALKLSNPELSDLHLITNTAAIYHGGVTIAPVLLAKGLEFDGVLIWNASDKEFSSNYLDAKLLYVALSRAMYYLKIFYQGRLTPLLRGER